MNLLMIYLLCIASLICVSYSAVDVIEAYKDRRIKVIIISAIALLSSLLSTLISLDIIFFSMRMYPFITNGNTTMYARILNGSEFIHYKMILFGLIISLIMIFISKKTNQ